MSAPMKLRLRTPSPMWTIAFLTVVFLTLAVACSGTRIRSGQVGVRVVDIGAHAGVQEHELGVGWYFPQPGSYVLKFPTTTRTEVWADNDNSIGPAIQFNNADGVPTRMAVSVQVRIDPERASNAVQRYRLGFEDMVRGPVRSLIDFGAFGSFFRLSVFGTCRAAIPHLRHTSGSIAPRGTCSSSPTTVATPAMTSGSGRYAIRLRTRSLRRTPRSLAP